jgi:tRNA splicing ligase
MTADIVERLRAPSHQFKALMLEAADEIERLRAFVRWALQEGSWSGAELNGGDIQDKAVELNLVVKTKYDPAVHGEDDCAEPGDDWYVLR